MEPPLGRSLLRASLDALPADRTLVVLHQQEDPHDQRLVVVPERVHNGLEHRFENAAAVVICRVMPRRILSFGCPRSPSLCVGGESAVVASPASDPA